MFTYVFTKFLFGGSLEISLSTGRDVDGGKAVYIWISPDPTKAGPILGVVVVVVVNPSDMIVMDQKQKMKKKGHLNL